MRRLSFLAIAAAALGRAGADVGAAAGRHALGVYGEWGEFRDARPSRCFAISEPDRAIAPAKPEWRPFFAVSDWPSRKARGQVHLRLSKPRRPGKPLRLTVGTARFDLVSAGSEAWAPAAPTARAPVAPPRTHRRAEG